MKKDNSYNIGVIRAIPLICGILIILLAILNLKLFPYLTFLTAL